MIIDEEVSATTVRDAIKAGPEAVRALKEKVKEARQQGSDSAPAKGQGKKAPKPDKKKKVTAKALRGTPAEKKAGKKSKKADIASDEIGLKMKKYEARIIADKLAGDDDETVKKFVADIEMALL